MPEAASASMADVAQRAGVSVATVSRALRGSELVSPTTRKRVQVAAEELSFAVSRAASSLATGKVGRIAVLVSGHLGAWFNGSILDGIYGRLREEGLELTIYRLTDVTERAHFFATLPARRNADALIVASFALTQVEHERLRDLSMPVVYLNQTVPGAASVSIDDVAGTRDGVRHLLNLGHRRITFVTINNRVGFFYSAAHRIEGYRAELAAAGVPAAEQSTLVARSWDDGEHVVRQMLASAVVPTALMVESDELAMSLMSALTRLGLGVPSDVSVLGFDDHEMAVVFGLSTVAQPVGLLGREAASLAVTLASGGSVSAREIRVPTELVLRQSTARPKTREQP